MTDRNLTFRTQSPEETREVGRKLAPLLRPDDVLALCGTLGAGKTCLVKGIARGLGVEDEREVSSASFLLLKQHEGRLQLNHFDAYRLNDETDMDAIGCDEIFHSGGVSVIEWADRVAACLPSEHFTIEIKVKGETTRQFRVTASGEESENRLPDIASALEQQTAC
jgi:tRNA threonylcarbamoyladenosine biosynthesis protein TsaE